MELKIRDVKKVTDAILDHIINDLKVEKFTIEDARDFYWNVPSDKLFGVTESQPQLDIGRLADDWEFLEPPLKDKNQAIALILMHLAPLLRHIGEEIGQ